MLPIEFEQAPFREIQVRLDLHDGRLDPRCRSKRCLNARRRDLTGWPAAPTKEPPPIREAAFASLKAPLLPVPAPVDPTDASEEREVSGR
jgi:hypothetical protein